MEIYENCPEPDILGGFRRFDFHGGWRGAARHDGRQRPRRPGRIAKGRLAESNAQQVAKIRRILEDLSLEIATPAEARERLALKGGDRVGF